MTGAVGRKQEVEFTYGDGPARLVAVPEERIGACYGCGEPTIGISRNGNRQCPRCRQEADALEANRLARDLDRQARREWWLGVISRLRGAIWMVLLIVLTALTLVLLAAGAAVCMCGLGVQRLWERLRVWSVIDLMLLVFVLGALAYIGWIYGAAYLDWFQAGGAQ
jgi:hypothetical protein